MTRKDYQMIAEAIRDAGNPAPKEARDYIENVATYIADGCAKDNPRFDRKRFMAACGFSA